MTTGKGREVKAFLDELTPDRGKRAEGAGRQIVTLGMLFVISEPHICTTKVESEMTPTLFKRAK